MKYKPMKKPYHICFTLSIILFMAGCTHEIDKIVVPINNATLDLNRSTQKIDMPIDLFPDTGLKLKGSKVVIEKHF